MKWTRTPNGLYVSGDYTLTQARWRATPEGWMISYRGEQIDSRRLLRDAKKRAERHAAKVSG